ncbi:MAG: tRNA-specific adenosine deaminase [Bacteroidetes bacterium]|nr:tRNA-specific adenosine deaminase [Bacteroidota bacterium]
MQPTPKDLFFLDLAVDLARQGALSKMGGPFGAVVVRNGEIIGRGHNQVAGSNDPTAHAEIVAIRDACNTLGSYQLDGCVLYSSCEPCPMCLGAIYWSRPDRVWFAATRHDAAATGFDDNHIYEELALELPERRIPFLQVTRPAALDVFALWNNKADKIPY